ncbi:GNAT family N-acetyltransferase [Methylobrevis pamukkalensis]|uniref:BioF2-like acetyltransferase domain-containing protein n=1 Tax=Methylobrevis pamukkalensis TaxID=1439726 RepID=A0A1E3H7A0_9HYPH|nr:GNAT family N-acetyltransferase [Methylobrevis pamukkalensis]ODN71381.1 hypothetical protein A6302_01245 [Methylobrevis pamukkalensis]
MLSNDAMPDSRPAVDWTETLLTERSTAAGTMDPATLNMRVFDRADDAELWVAWDQIESYGHLTVFQSRFFMERFLKVVAPASGATPAVVVACDAHGRPQVIAPFVRLRRQGVTVLELADLDLCDYAAPLLGPAAQFDVAGAIALWQRILAALPRADVVRMKKMPPQIGPLPNPFVLLPGVAEMGVTTAVVPMAGTDITKSSAYKDAAGKIRKMKREGDYAFEVVTDPDEISKIIDVMIAQRHDRCAELGQHSNLDHPAIGGFFKELAMAGAADGRTSVTATKYDGQYIATFLGYVHRGRFNGIITAMGCDSFRRYSPGLCNMVATQEYWKNAGLDVFDIGVGAHSYKTRFGGTGLELSEYQQALTLRGFLLAFEAKIRRRGRQFLEQHPDLNRRIRRLLHK